MAQFSPPAACAREATFMRNQGGSWRAPKKEKKGKNKFKKGLDENEGNTGEEKGRLHEFAEKQSVRVCFTSG